MSFKKYPSLTNHYMEKDIEKLKERYWDHLNKTEFVIQEKLDGANTSILFQKSQPAEYFSRNQSIGNYKDGTEFFGSSKAFATAVDKLYKIQTFVELTNKTIRLYGELVGPTIQRTVNYGLEKRIIFYDLMSNDKHRTVQDFENFMYDIGCGSLTVPKLGIEPTFEEAIAYLTEFDSLVMRKPDNMCEGIVVKPWNKVFEDQNGSLFYIKKKNEQESKPKKVRVIAEYSDEVNKWHEIFLSYIHEARCESVFSKEGRIESMKEIGKFISLIHKDAMETFKKESDYPEESFTKKEKQYIMNSSKTIVPLLKGFL